MIELIHKHPVLIKILLAVVTVTFVLTGGWLLGKEDKLEYAAKVGGQKITRLQYEDAVYKMDEFYRKVYQGNMPEDMRKKLDINKRALDALVDRMIIVMEAQKKGLSVSDQEVSEAITGDAKFQGPDGSFSKERYVEVLKFNRMTPALYEKQLREDLTVEKFRKLVKDSVYVGEEDLRQAYKKQVEQQGKPFKEEEFQAQKEGLWRIQTLLTQDKTMSSFMEGLRKSYKVEVNPQVVVSG